MKTLLRVLVTAVLIGIIEPGRAQNRTAIVTGGGMTPPADGAVIVAGGTPVTPAAPAIANTNAFGSISGQVASGAAANAAGINTATVQTNHSTTPRAMTNGASVQPVPNTPSRSLLPGGNQ